MFENEPNSWENVAVERHNFYDEPKVEAVKFVSLRVHLEPLSVENGGLVLEDGDDVKHLFQDMPSAEITKNGCKVEAWHEDMRKIQLE